MHITNYVQLNMYHEISIMKCINRNLCVCKSLTSSNKYFLILYTKEKEKKYIILLHTHFVI